jgi:hypothetical protein
MSFLNESRHCEEELVKTTKKVDGKKWLGYDIDRFKKLGYNVVMFKQVMYVLYEDLANSLRGFVDRLTNFIRGHQFGYEHQDLLSELMLYAVDYMCMEFNIIFRNIRSLNTFSVQKFLNDVDKLPIVSEGGYLIEKYNELSMVRSMKSNSSLMSIIDSKTKRKKSNGKNGSGKSGDLDNNKSNDTDGSPKSNKSDNSEKRKKSKTIDTNVDSKSDNKDVRKICVAYNSADGCKYGDKCKFTHGDPVTESDKQFVKKFLGNRAVRPGLDLN